MFSYFPTCVKSGSGSTSKWKFGSGSESASKRCQPTTMVLQVQSQHPPRGGRWSSVEKNTCEKYTHKNLFSGRKHSLCWHPYLLVKINKNRLAGFAYTAAARDLLELVGPGHGIRMRNESWECCRYSKLEKNLFFFSPLILFCFDELVNNNFCLHVLD